MADAAAAILVWVGVGDRTSGVVWLMAIVNIEMLKNNSKAFGGDLGRVFSIGEVVDEKIDKMHACHFLRGPVLYHRL